MKKSSENYKILYKGIIRYGYEVDRKMDKIKIAIFDTSNFKHHDGGIYWGHFIKYDWFEADSPDLTII